MAHSKKPNRTTHRSLSEYKTAMKAWNKAHSGKTDGTTAKERLDAKQKALDEARKPTVKSSETNKKTLKKKTTKPNLVQTPSPTWGVKKTNTGEKLSKKINNKDTPKETSKETKKKKITARSRMEARNREIHGDDKIDALKKKNKAFQAAKKKKGGMKEFAKNFPNSQTAKRRKLKIATWRDVE
mgnify:CR=1 FL=1|tara:strand:+ start:73 stop:624 length:552 start_codon:yes stop_codon:yes gene_type:complete